MNNNKYIYVVALIGVVVALPLPAMLRAADKKIALRAQKNEQCPCKQCTNKWFKSLRSHNAHPYTDQEKTFAYAVRVLSGDSAGNGQFLPMIPLVLTYVFGDYTSEAWLEMEPLSGKFYALNYPLLMLTNGTSQKILDQDEIVFDACCLRALDNSLHEPLQSSLAISTNGKFKLAVSWTLDGQKSLIQRYVRLDHAQRIQQLITAS